MNRNKLQPGWEDIDELLARIAALEQTISDIALKASVGRTAALNPNMRQALTGIAERCGAALDAQLPKKPL